MRNQTCKIDISTDTPAFRVLLSALSEHLGHHQLPLNSRAGDFESFIPGGGVHEELTKPLFRQLAERAGASKDLDQPVRLDDALDFIGHTRAALIKQGQIDIDQLRLLDEIGEFLASLYRRVEQMMDKRTLNQPGHQQTHANTFPPTLVESTPANR